jgi:16S rRNA (guanine527-N7)-methyltransferase
MEIIGKYFSLSPEQAVMFEKLGPLYSYWNERINVISRKDIENLYLHHILHSLSIAKIIQFKPGTTILDAGTGGGFPGIPLAILFPECHFILADSIKKKITVVDEIIKETGLKNCKTRNIRLEELKDKADFVVCRAVTALPELLKLVRKIISAGGQNTLKNGLLALKGGELEEELRPVKERSVIYKLSDYFEEPFFETKRLVYVESMSC